LIPLTPYGKRLAYYAAVTEIVEEIRAIEADPASVLAQAGVAVLERRLSPGDGSPGGMEVGNQFLLRAFSHVDEVLSSSSTAPPSTEEKTYRWVGFRFGITVYDAEQALNGTLIT
jgi:hypothetical protein